MVLSLRPTEDRFLQLSLFFGGLVLNGQEPFSRACSDSRCENKETKKKREETNRLCAVGFLLFSNDVHESKKGVNDTNTCLGQWKKGVVVY